MIHIEEVSFSYNKLFETIKNANATINPGIYLLVGENGAGKTTLLHLLSGLLHPQKGQCKIDGSDISQRKPSDLQRVFYLPDDFVCPFATINKLAAGHAGFYPHFDPGMLAENLRTFEMNGNESIKSLSLGMRRKAFAAYALSLGVDLLLLDEPTNGIDISSKKELKRMIGRCVKDEQTVIISTHTTSDLESIYDSIMVMHQGQLLITKSIAEIAQKVAFLKSGTPVLHCLYQEPVAGAFHAITTNNGEYDTDVDFTLLFSALISPASEAIIKTINSD